MTTIRAPFQPRTCLSCVRPLETWGAPPEVGSYVPCVHCAHLYRVTETGLVHVLLDEEPPEFRALFDALITSWWADRCRDVLAA